MEPNWIIVSAVITTAIALIIFLIWRNQRDKKELEEKLIDEDELSVPKSNETEDNSLV
jgi:preprotein translocase subunit YajC